MSDKVGYRLLLWCRDCNGYDFQGCFDGGSELQEEVYPTITEAIKAGYKETDGPPWEFEIQDLEGNVIDYEAKLF